MMEMTTLILYSSRTGLTAALITLCVHGTVSAQTEIHKCTDADGGIVYSQLPCAPEKPIGAESSEPEELAEAPESVAFNHEILVTEDTNQSEKTAEEVAACKQRYRDAIDGIDAEIGRDFSTEKADEYKQRLLELTRQLRRC